MLAAVCYAGAAIFGRGFKGLDPMAPAAGSLLCGAAILIPLSLVVERPWTLAPSTNSMLALLGLAVFSTAFAFVIYFRLIQTLGSVGTTAQAYLRVPIGVALGVLFLGEQLSSTAWIGLGCVVIGVAAMTIPASEAEAGRGGGVSAFRLAATRTLAAAERLSASCARTRRPRCRQGDGQDTQHEISADRCDRRRVAGMFSPRRMQAQAQENFPNRPIRIVIPYSPGSVADVFARIIGQNMQEQWKGSIVVESKSGANGSIAAEEVARAAPDGYTWLLVTTFFIASPALNDFAALGSGPGFRSRRTGVPRAEFLHRARQHCR